MRLVFGLFFFFTLSVYLIYIKKMSIENGRLLYELSALWLVLYIRFDCLFQLATILRVLRVEGEAYIKNYHDPDFPFLNFTGVYHDRRYHSCRSTIYSCRWLCSLNKWNDWILDDMNLLLMVG